MQAISTEKAVLEEFFSSSRFDQTSSIRSVDPSERIEFSRPPERCAMRFDTRSDAHLVEVAVDHPSTLERERALWEYADRHADAALPLLQRAVASDPSAAIRSSTLWAIQKFAGRCGTSTIAAAFDDESPEVQDWARLLIREIGEANAETLRRPTKYSDTNPFDQTLPLLIAGYARLYMPAAGWVQATLSPQWFESIMGRVMACTMEKSFESDLIIEKCISGYHSDGSNHYEGYKFRGFTTQLSDAVAYHQYDGEGRHTFYPSGKVEDSSQPPFDDMIVNMNRAALTVRVGDPDSPSKRIVQSVRGRYMGSAFINPGRIIANGMVIGPGEVQLCNANHPGAGMLTNTHLAGTFRGKLSDLDGDGFLDVNTEACHVTTAGLLDADLDGTADDDPFDPFGVRK